MSASTHDIRTGKPCPTAAAHLADGVAGLDKRGLLEAVPAIMRRPQCRARAGADVEQAGRREVRPHFGDRCQAGADGRISRRQPRRQIGLSGEPVRQMQPAVAHFAAIAVRQKIGGALQVGERNALQRLVDGLPQRGRKFHLS